MLYVFKIILKMKICVEEASFSLLFSYMDLVISKGLFSMVSVQVSAAIYPPNNFLIIMRISFIGAREMTEWVKCLKHNHEVPSSDI